MKRIKMKDKNLRRLGRRELLELLISQQEQNEALQKRVAELEALLQNRELQFENVGSLAEAALKLGGVFEAADQAAAIYKDSLMRLSLQQEPTEIPEAEETDTDDHEAEEMNPDDHQCQQPTGEAEE